MDAHYLAIVAEDFLPSVFMNLLFFDVAHIAFEAKRIHTNFISGNLYLNLFYDSLLLWEFQTIL
jgi:hypothetical protein